MLSSNHCQNGSIHETHKDIPAAVVDGMIPNSKYLQLKACKSCLTLMACRKTKRGQEGAVRFYISIPLFRAMKQIKRQILSLSGHVKLDFPLEIRLQNVRTRVSIVNNARFSAPGMTINRPLHPVSCMFHPPAEPARRGLSVSTCHPFASRGRRAVRR
jgi:hypothetical protein